MRDGLVVSARRCDHARAWVRGSDTSLAPQHVTQIGADLTDQQAVPAMLVRRPERLSPASGLHGVRGGLCSALRLPVQSRGALGDWLPIGLARAWGRSADLGSTGAADRPGSRQHPARPRPGTPLCSRAADFPSWHMTVGPSIADGPTVSRGQAAVFSPSRHAAVSSVSSASLHRPPPGAARGSQHPIAAPPRGGRRVDGDS